MNKTETAKRVKEPLLRVSKRMDFSMPKRIGAIVGSIAAALVFGSVLIAILGYNPFLFWKFVFEGCFKNPLSIAGTLRIFVPLTIVSLGIAVAFKMRFWNIGAEGQILIGAIVALTFGLLIGDKLPKPWGTIIIVLLGAVGGGLYALITAALKVKFNTNETLMTLMLNYIALYLVSYLMRTDFFKTKASSIPSFEPLNSSLWLSTIKLGNLTLDTSFIIAIALIVFFFVYFRYTKHGYEIAVIGDSPATARYSGMKVGRIMLRTIFLSGFVVGLAGALQLTGKACDGVMSTGITSGMGWTGIIIAWLAKLNPFGIAIGSFLLAILEKGSSVARSSMGISSAMADVLQGIILFFVLAGDFIVHYQISVRRKPQTPEQTAQKKHAAFLKYAKRNGHTAQDYLAGVVIGGAPLTQCDNERISADGTQNTDMPALSDETITPRLDRAAQPNNEDETREKGEGGLR